MLGVSPETWGMIPVKAGMLHITPLVQHLFMQRWGFQQRVSTGILCHCDSVSDLPKAVKLNCTCFMPQLRPTCLCLCLQTAGAKAMVDAVYRKPSSSSSSSLTPAQLEDLLLCPCKA
jgi:hypothetical protein